MKLYGNVGLNTPDQFGSGVGVLSLKNASTNPTTGPVNCSILYAKDVAASSEMFAYGEDTTESQISSHRFEMFEPDPADLIPFSHWSRNLLIGKQVNAYISGALLAVEELYRQVFGINKKFVYYYDIDPAEKKSVTEYLKEKELYLAEQWRAENSVEIKITQTEAVETVEIIDTSIDNIIDYENQYVIDETTGEVILKIIPIYGDKTVVKTVLRPNVRLDETTGEFYLRQMPTIDDAKLAIKNHPKLVLKKWIKERITT